jgi:hypothetical protein
MSNRRCANQGRWRMAVVGKRLMGSPAHHMRVSTALPWDAHALCLGSFEAWCQFVVARSALVPSASRLR